MLTITWSGFVDELITQLQGDGTYLQLDATCYRELDLTHAIGRGIRRLFRDRLPVTDTLGIQDHVPYHQGAEPGDGAAWKAARPDKWITMHGVRFVPDVLVRRTLKRVTETVNGAS